ncbi:hypothetical protein PIB30_047481 [Stylosanthes scabra]|uniref:Uncharacterized protein n=1 Tax=Stylosanthes scabra TaxID=79078 RepID=A0ABU6RHD4_9FABA|nr:hypothetical protein [Stylosanthes scabra]
MEFENRGETVWEVFDSASHSLSHKKWKPSHMKITKSKPPTTRNGREDSDRTRRNTQEKMKTSLREIKFRFTTTVAAMFEYMKDYPDKLRLVNEMGFGALSHLPTNNLDQQLLKQIYDRYDIHDNTIYSNAAAVKLTTRKIGDALGLCSKGTAYETRVVRKNLSQEDKDVHKFFQGKTAVELTELKAFLLPNSTARIVPTALTTIFDLETTSKRNWALHVHDFLILELKKAKQNNAAAIHECVYVLMIIYFHETQFGENLKEIEARAPWIAYWKGDTLKRRLKQERTHEAGLLKKGEMMAKKDISNRKNPTMRVPPSRRDSDPDSEAIESNLAEDSEPDLEPEPEPKHDAHDKPPPQREIRSKKRNDRAVVGSNAPVIRTQQSVAEPDLGRDESDNGAVEGPGVVPSEPPHKETEVHHEKTTDAGVNDNTAVEVPPTHQKLPIHNDQPPESSDAAADVPPLAEDIQDATEPEPLTVVVPLQSEQQPEPQRTSEEPTEVEPEPNTINIPLELEPELTLRPWLQYEAGTSAEKDATKSVDDMITDVLISMKQDEQSTQVENEPQNEDQGQCRTPEAALASMEERCFIWATTNNDNKEEVERYQRDIYCVPPEILTLMFETYGTNYLDKKTKKPHLISSLKDQEYMELLDKEKLKTTSAVSCCNHHQHIDLADTKRGMKSDDGSSASRRSAGGEGGERSSAKTQGFFAARPDTPLWPCVFR